MKVAALDLGTNTFLCLIAEVENSSVTRVYDDQVRVVRLGQDVAKTKMFHPEALARAKTALQEFAKTIDSQKVDKVLAMATSAARDVGNADELFAIAKDLKIPIQIIPGSREAEITFRGAVSGFQDQKRRLVVDVGGGSTELITGTGLKYHAGESLDVGSVRLTEKYASKTPVTSEKVAEVRQIIHEQVLHVVKSLVGFAGGLDEVLAVAGTPTELARIELGGEFNAQKIDGYSLTQEQLDAWIEKFRQAPVEKIISDYDVHPGRADVILAGTLILSEALRASGQPSMKVSTRGVRYGVALEMA